MLKKISILLFLLICGQGVWAQKYLSKEMAEVSNQWNGNTFTSSKTFAENIAEAPEFTILSKVVKDESIGKAIEKNEMVTIFAIGDKAFDKLNKNQRDSILDNKVIMVNMVRYLMVPGRIDKHGLQTEAKNHNGQFSLATVEGQNLKVMETEGQLYLTDSKGRRAAIIEGDFYHKNGLFHIIDAIILPDSAE